MPEAIHVDHPDVMTNPIGRSKAQAARRRLRDVKFLMRSCGAGWIKFVLSANIR